MTPNIIKTHTFAKDIFKAKKINTKFKYLNLEIILDKKFNSPDPFGIYFMFFKKKLIYIGSWCGNWDKEKKKLVGSASNERWYKHIITDTTRFQDITFKREDNKFDINEIRNVLKNHDEQIKTNDKGKVTLATAIDLYKQNKVKVSKYENLINSRFSDINSKIVSEYCNHNSVSTIFDDLIVPLKDIKYNDTKEHQKILTGGSMAHSPNRFKISDKFWDEFKNRDENTIFNDFEFCYFNFNEIIKKIKTKEDKLKYKKIINQIELHYAKKYTPPGNTNKKNQKWIIKYDLSVLSEVENTLTETYKNINDRFI